jgi:hypothetical protein
MADMLSRLNGPEFIGLIVAVLLLGGGMLVGLLLGLAGIITSHRRGLRQVELEMALKQEMVRKGMSAEDIERVIRATRPAEEKPSPSAAAPTEQATNDLTARQLDVRLATDLAAAGMDADRIQQAVGAVVVADIDTKRAVVQAVSTMIENGTDEEQIHAAIMALSQIEHGPWSRPSRP